MKKSYQTETPPLVSKTSVHTQPTVDVPYDADTNILTLNGAFQVVDLIDTRNGTVVASAHPVVSKRRF